MNATIENNELIIRIAMFPKPQPSSSGKTLVVASTGGFAASTAQVDGKIVKISVNATVPLK